MSEPEVTPGRRRGLRVLVVKLYVLFLRGTLWFTPRPTAAALRRLFAAAVAGRAARQLASAPKDVVAILDERYDVHPDALLDVYIPAQVAEARLPTVVWTHGGAFVGGSKDELGGYFRMLAARGFAVVAPRYSLAPDEIYPMPVRQGMAVLRHVQQNAQRLHLDPDRIVLAGDSAGAQISAQLAALITNPAYAQELGITPTATPSQLRGLVACCGVYDLGSLGSGGPFAPLMAAVGWAYSGSRHYERNTAFSSTISVTDRVTRAFPPAFVTAGNTDPLLPQSRRLVEVLSAAGVEVDALFYADDHAPLLGHEYQFELDTEDGRAATERIVRFVAAHAQAPGSPVSATPEHTEDDPTISR